MYFFIATIFIAELIIAGTVLKWIWTADKAVCKFNEDVTSSRVKITEGLAIFKKEVHSLERAVSFVICYMHKKREEIILKIIKSILTYLLIVMIDAKFSKAAKLKKWVGYGKALVRRVLA